MEEYLDMCRWFIRLKPFQAKIDRCDSEIYEETGDSYDIPEPFIADDVMKIKSYCIHFKFMVMVF